MERSLVIFARAPQRGAVKRRLAADIGEQAAFEFHVRTTRILLRRVTRDRRWSVTVAVTPDTEAGHALFALPGVDVVPQGNGDLGVRMRRFLVRPPPGPVVIAGTDIPDLGHRHIADAFHALARADAVFGPSVDGGYWLVGLRRRGLAHRLFRGVRISTEHALADTLANLEGASFELLETLTDVDTAEDLRAVSGET